MSITSPSKGTHFSDGVRTGPILGSTFIPGTNVLTPSVMVSSPIDQLAPGVFNTPQALLDIVPAPVSDDSIMAAFTVIEAGDLQLVTISGIGITIVTYQGISNVIQLDCARNITISGLAGDVTATIFFVFGWDQYGMPLVEQIDISNGIGKSQGDKTFLLIRSIYAASETGNNISIGVGNTFGFPYLLASANYLFESNFDDVPDNGTVTIADQKIATATTGDVRGTYIPETEADGIKKLTLNMYAASGDARNFDFANSGTINLINNPLTTSVGEPIIIVRAANHQLISGQNITISGAVGFDGLTAAQLNITAPITIISDNQFQYTALANATASSDGGGNVVVLSPARGALYATPIGRFGVAQFSETPF